MLEHASILRVHACVPVLPNKVQFCLPEFPNMWFQAFGPAYLIAADPPEGYTGHVFVRHAHPQSGGHVLYLLPYDNDAAQFFDAALQVQGVGPASVVTMMTKAGLQEVLAALRSANAAEFYSLPGMGGKTGERVFTELVKVFAKGKPITKEPVAREDRQMVEDAEAALKRLGYKAADAKAVVEKTVNRLQQKQKKIDNLDHLVAECFKNV